jgi:hydrogenase maturation protein HypF
VAASFEGREARLISIGGVVQGVGFRPHVARLAARHALSGWVLNDQEGVRMHVEGAEAAIDVFLGELWTEAPPAAQISSMETRRVPAEGFGGFEIRPSERGPSTVVPISADLPVCDECLREIRDPRERRYGYPYVNCTNCGPRYSVVLGLPYDRPNTTMRAWELCEPCEVEYENPLDRRYHAQPIACPVCGPHLALVADDGTVRGDARAIEAAAELLKLGAVLAIKGIGGYHLACDARNDAAVASLRRRKFRKEKPFAVMARDLDAARALVDLDPLSEKLLRTPARPIVLAPAREERPLIAPDQARLGVMLPYAPIHHLLFAAGAPEAIVLTSGNRSSEPIAYEDEDARERLGPLCDAMLTGERPIARRVDDSVAVNGPFGIQLLRRSRGYAPGVVARLPSRGPILALGADLKNTVTLAVDGQAIVSPHIGDLEELAAAVAFEEAIADLLAMYRLAPRDVTVVHDLHPQYRSTLHALELSDAPIGVQHHHAHIASALAEHVRYDERVVGLALDGTGYGLDGAIWGCEILTGSIRGGFDRAAHLAPIALPGGDGAARHPVLCAIPYTTELGIDPMRPPFDFPHEALLGRSLYERRFQTHESTSAGRLFDAAAALCGFTRRVSFEAQAAMWLEHLAARGGDAGAYDMRFEDGLLQGTDLIEQVCADRKNGRSPEAIARAFHRGFARALAGAAQAIASETGAATIVLSGGVWQNELLAGETLDLLEKAGLEVLSNRQVPVNDGGISLGQAAIASCRLD